MLSLRWIACALLAAAPKLLPAQEDVVKSNSPTNVLVEQLLSDNQSVARRAAESLTRRCEFEVDWWDGTPEEIAAHEQVVEELRPHIRQLISALDHRDAAVRDSALRCLSLLGPAAQDAAPRVWELGRRAFSAGDDEPLTEILEVLTVLRSILPDDVPAMECVVQLLRELPEEEKRRLRELHVVRKPPEHDDTICVEGDGIVDFADFRTHVSGASERLLLLGWGAVEAPGLEELSASDFPLVVRLYAVLTLTAMTQEMGQEAVSVLPTLTKLLDSDDALLRYSAANALIAIQQDETPLEEILNRARLPQEDQIALRECLRKLISDEHRTREYLRGLDRRNDADQIQYYINALKYGRGSVRRAALRRLNQIGPDAAAALPEIGAALNDRDEETRRLAQEAIAAIYLAEQSDGVKPTSN